MLCYNIDTSLHVVMQMKAYKFFLVVIAVSLIQIFRGQTFVFLPPSVLILKRLWGCGTYHFSLAASTDKTYFHVDRPNFPDGRLKGIMRTSGEIDFRFRLKLKITLVESTYPNALNVPLCPLIFSWKLSYLYVDDAARAWFTSFLTNKNHVNSCNDVCSDRSCLYISIGVAQGSILGPLLCGYQNTGQVFDCS